jgi:hypothetical protein
MAYRSYSYSDDESDDYYTAYEAAGDLGALRCDKHDFQRCIEDNREMIENGGCPEICGTEIAECEEELESVCARNTEFLDKWLATKEDEYLKFFSADDVADLSVEDLEDMIEETIGKMYSLHKLIRRAPYPDDFNEGFLEKCGNYLAKCYHALKIHKDSKQSDDSISSFSCW